MRTILALSVVMFLGCVPQKNTALADIPKLATLDDVMDNQATTADPLFKKIGASSFTDADFAALATAGERLQATSLKIKDFSKGPDFDALALRLNEKAKDLSKAAGAKDGAAASTALGDMKATCKECHGKFK